jgi:hypothetical protein
MKAEIIQSRQIDEPRLPPASEGFQAGALKTLATDGYRIEADGAGCVLRHDSEPEIALLRGANPDEILMLLVVTGAWSTNADRTV